MSIFAPCYCLLLSLTDAITVSWSTSIIFYEHTVVAFYEYVHDTFIGTSRALLLLWYVHLDISLLMLLWWRFIIRLQGLFGMSKSSLHVCFWNMIRLQVPFRDQFLSVDIGIFWYVTLEQILHQLLCTTTLMEVYGMCPTWYDTLKQVLKETLYHCWCWL